MAKKKTENKELKPKKVKKEEIAIPNTPLVKIIFLANGKEYTKSNDVATILIKNGKAKLA